jgi:hypothetical protein
MINFQHLNQQNLKNSQKFRIKTKQSASPRLRESSTAERSPTFQCVGVAQPTILHKLKQFFVFPPVVLNCFPRKYEGAKDNFASVLCVDRQCSE